MALIELKKFIVTLDLTYSTSLEAVDVRTDWTFHRFGPSWQFHSFINLLSTIPSTTSRLRSVRWTVGDKKYLGYGSFYTIPPFQGLDLGTLDMVLRGFKSLENIVLDVKEEPDGEDEVVAWKHAVEIALPSVSGRGLLKLEVPPPSRP